MTREHLGEDLDWVVRLVGTDPIEGFDQEHIGRFSTDLFRLRIRETGGREHEVVVKRPYRSDRTGESYELEIRSSKCD